MTRTQLFASCVLVTAALTAVGCVRAVSAPATMPAPAETEAAASPVIAKPDILSHLTDGQLEEVFRGLGFEYEKLKEGVYRFYLSGYKVMVFNGGDNLLLFAGFGAQPSLADINAWNQNKKYSRAYLDSDGDAIVESDLNLEGGVTHQNIQAFIMTFRMTVNAFADKVFRSAAAKPTWQS